MSDSALGALGAQAPLQAASSEAAKRAFAHLLSTQSDNGCWSADYSGPMFLLPMYIGTLHLVGRPPPEPTRASMQRYILAHQNPDGGFGLHNEGASLVFSTSLNYVALRLLGAQPEEPPLALARGYLHARGGPLYSASWGKFVLALLGLYDYRGLAPLLPELWLLPSWLPIHPARMWCHARMVYLPMSYLYGARAHAALDPTLQALRAELYPEPYESITWESHLESVAGEDALIPRAPEVRLLDRLLVFAERHIPQSLRQRAMARILEIVDIEDQSTHYVCLGPINKLYNLLVWHFAEPGGSRLERHLERLPDYLWTDQAGSRMKGYNSSEFWDTAFAVQALGAALDHGLVAPADAAPALRRAYGYLEATQVVEDPERKELGFRNGTLGGFPFSTRAHGWPISDCTAEGIKAALLIERHLGLALPSERLERAVDWMISVRGIL